MFVDVLPASKELRLAGGQRMTQANGSIEDLAASWLAAEREAAASDNGGRTEEWARVASAAYDAAVTAATGEELLLAWRAATRAQATTEMGSKAWVEARAFVTTV
jgi:hypothetical protein